MQSRVWLLVAIGGFACGGPLAHGTTPLEATPAFVQRDHTMVRSGPGDQYYPTQSLSAGEEVEVYRYDGDWAAIRPPDGSFSWLPADHVSPTERYDVAEVQNGPVQTRVGSLLSHERFVAYVTLQTGERVRLLAADPHVESAVPDDAWLRIAPPAGEFRWVHRGDLGDHEPALEPDSDGLDLAGDGEAPGSSWQSSLDNLRQAIHTMLPDESSSGPAIAAADPPEWSRQGSVVPASGESPWELEATDPVDGDGGAAVDSLAHGPATELSGSPPPTLSLASELTRVAADLTQTVSQAPGTWVLAPLRRRAQAVIDASDSPDVRDQGLRLLARIAQFEDLQRRHRQLARGSSPDLESLARLSATRRRTANPGVPEGLPAIDVKQYDGFGWLMPVASKSPRSPRYVLTDQHGNILQFVTPSPGMNLRRYERKQVGVYGQRGFLPSLQQPHLVAERVVSIDALR